jgi:hypothetical protein
MQRIAVLLTLSLSFIAPLAIPSAQAAPGGTVTERSSSCKNRAAKKRADDKPKKKDKEKKPYGFEL